MKFLFSQRSENATTLVIVENPKVKENTVYATQVGVFNGWNDEGKEIYKACSPVKFIAGGGPWTLTEYTEELKPN